MTVFDCIILIVICLYLLLILGSIFIVCAFCHFQKRRVGIVDESAIVNQKRDTVVSSNKKSKLKKSVINCVTGLTHYLCIRVGRIPSFLIRNFTYKYIFCMDIDKKTIIYGGCEFRNPWNISIGRSVIGPNNIIDGRNKVTIGNNVCTANNCSIWTMQHDPNSKDFGTKSSPVIVEDYAWISSRTTILPGVKIRKGSVVACNAVVTKDCEEFSIYMGIPAKKKGNRMDNLDYSFSDHWWFF